MAKQITTVLIDLSGTLHIDNTAIPGAIQALNRLGFLFVLIFFNLYMFYCKLYIQLQHNLREKIAQFNIKFPK